jgi:hypothetical protein
VWRVELRRGLLWALVVRQRDEHVRLERHLLHGIELVSGRDLVLHRIV